MSWVGGLLLLVGVSGAMPAFRGLLLALGSHSPNIFDRVWVAFFWGSWTAIGAFVTVFGFDAIWPTIALIVLTCVHLALNLRWRIRHS